MTIEIIVGLPHLNRGPLLSRAIERRYPVLVSATAFSRWSRRDGYPRWIGWKYGSLTNAAAPRSINLDSTGFVAAPKHYGIPWTVNADSSGMPSAFNAVSDEYLVDVRQIAKATPDWRMPHMLRSTNVGSRGGEK